MKTLRATIMVLLLFALWLGQALPASADGVIIPIVPPQPPRPPVPLRAFEARLVEAAAKCEAYAGRETARALQAWRADCVTLPAGIDYGQLPLRAEARQRLAAARPRTLGEARSLFGVTPADLAVLAAAVRRGNVSRET